MSLLDARMYDRDGQVVVEFYLHDEDKRLHTVRLDGKTGHFLGETERYDSIVLDLGLPVMAGVSILRDWRDSGIATPVLILTARGSWQDCDDRPVAMTANELKLLGAFMLRPTSVHTKTELAETIYGYLEERESNTVEVFVARLRQKLGTGFIRTIRRRGYTLAGQ